jgi:hypothetical protein
VNGSGSYAIEATLTDNGEPGAGIDQFGLQVTGSPDRGLTFAPLTITSGNLQVR